MSPTKNFEHILKNQQLSQAENHQSSRIIKGIGRHILFELSKDSKKLLYAFEMVWPPIQFDRKATVARLIEPNPISDVLLQSSKHWSSSYSSAEILDIAAFSIFRAAKFCALDSAPESPMDQNSFEATRRYISSHRGGLFAPKTLRPLA